MRLGKALEKKQQNAHKNKDNYLSPTFQKTKVSTHPVWQYLVLSFPPHVKINKDKSL